MNAAEQATSLETASKQDFPDAKADLKPWMNDPETQELIDPDSIDIGFHFPGWSPRFQSRSILVQIRFFQDPEDEAKLKAIGVELVGFTHVGKQWHLSTIQTWEFEGEKQPHLETQFQLKRFCRKLLEVFNEQADS
jgi:hypothetical protein